MAGHDGAMDAGVGGVEDIEGDKGPRAGEEDGNVVLSGKTVLMRKQDAFHSDEYFGVLIGAFTFHYGGFAIQMMATTTFFLQTIRMHQFLALLPGTLIPGTRV